MKILFFIESLRAGGKERRIVELLKGLRKFDEVKIDLVLTRKEVHYSEIYSLNIPIHIIERKFIKKDPLLFIKLFILAKKIKPDIIHVWGHMVAVYSVPTKILLGLPLINNEITDSMPGKNKLGKWLVFRASNRVISNSYAGIVAYNAPINKSIVIYNGFDFNRLLGIEKESVVRRQFSIETNYVVGMVASFHKFKDYATYINAAQIVLEHRNDVTFLCVGEGNDSAYQKLVTGKNKDKVYFLGRQTNVESIMNICDIGVVLTNTEAHSEGISNSLMEFMALSKPVIATNFGGSVELIENNYSGFLVDPFSASQLQEKIQYLLDNPEARKGMGDQAFLRIRDKFSIRVMIENFYNEYRNLVKQSVGESKN